MRFPKIFTIFSSEEQSHSHSHNILPDSSIPVRQNLIQHLANSSTDGFPQSLFKHFRSFVFGSTFDGSPRSTTEKEEKVRSWLYALAQSEKDLVFEYVRSTERGLSFTEAERRLKENGPNIPFEYKFPSWWHLLWNAFFHPFNMILIVLSALSYIADDISNGCIMLTLVSVSVCIRFYQEHSSSRAAMKLYELVTCPVKVQRCAGRVIQTELIVQIDQRDVVPGDIIMFEPGDVFPGDVRLLSSKNLVVSQSSLTGESWTSEKAADIKQGHGTPLLELRNICFMGTNVVSGGGTGLVVSTGCNTYMNTMFANMGGKQKPPDGFEKGIRRISYFLVGLMLIVTTIIIVGQYLKSHFLSESMLFGLSVASALTPNMLPLIVNTSLAKGALAMARDRCIVKSLDAIRHMGCMDILCMDKTGTLTMNHPIVISHPDSWGLPNEEVLRFAFLNSYFKTDHKYPLDDAIMAYVYTNGYGYRFRPSKWIKLAEIPFDFMRRRVTVMLETEPNAGDSNSPLMFRFLITKGALEEVMQICSFIQRPDKGGTITSFSVEDHHRILHMVEELTSQGLRVIAVAAKKLETIYASDHATDVIIESDMVFLGVITFFDPPKDSAKQALWRLTERGVKAKVLTGDSLLLAVRICEELGIRTTNVTTGPELELLDQDSFHETVNRATVLARLTPTQKLRVVRSLQKVGGHVVGFLGDGVNDSLAIDAADIGVSVDSGASIAKDSADIVLLEKDLNVLVAGVEQGRLTLGNTMKYIKMSVIANIGGVLSLLIATLWLDFEPLTPRQLLTQTFIYSVGQITIPWDKLEEDYVRTPQKWSQKGLPMFILWNGSVCILIDLTNLVFLCCSWPQASDVKFFHSAFFLEGLLMQTLIFHLIRTEKIPFIQEIASCPVICSTAAISAVGIAIPFTPIGEAMGLVSLPLSYSGFLVLLFLGYFTMGQIIKKLYILIYKSWL